MNKMVNVKGTVKQPIIVGAELYQRGDMMDADFTIEEFNVVGKGLFERMIDGCEISKEQRPTEEKVEEKLVVENIQPQDEQAELKVPDEEVSDTVEKKPAQRGRPAKTK